MNLCVCMSVFFYNGLCIWPSISINHHLSNCWPIWSELIKSSTIKDIELSFNIAHWMQLMKSVTFDIQMGFNCGVNEHFSGKRSIFWKCVQNCERTWEWRTIAYGKPNIRSIIMRVYCWWRIEWLAFIQLPKYFSMRCAQRHLFV